MKSPNVYLDLDRTLFQTAQAGAIWDCIAQRHTGVDAQQERARAREYYIHTDDLYAYDMSQHLHGLGIDSAELYDEIASSELADGRFEFPGTESLVQYLRAIGWVGLLTYGIDDYQRLKARLCPSLAEVEVISTTEPKHLYFEAHPEPAWLVDDKPIGDTLPSYVGFIQAIPEPGAISPQGADWPVYRTLADVEQHLRTVL